MAGHENDGQSPGRRLGLALLCRSEHRSRMSGLCRKTDSLICFNKLESFSISLDHILMS